MNTPAQVKPVINLAFAKPSDGLAFAEIMMHAFYGDPNSAAFHPERFGLSAEEQVRIYGPALARGLQRGIVGNDIYVKASIQTLVGPRGEIIVGWAHWKSPPSQKRRVRRTLWEWFLAWVVYPLQERLCPNCLPPRLPSSVRELMRAQYDATFSPEGQEPWYLVVLCVHPKWQGIGAGKALLSWGMDNAQRDNVPVYLESSLRATKFYISRGFGYASVQSCSVDNYTVSIPGMIWFPTVKCYN